MPMPGQDLVSTRHKVGIVEQHLLKERSGIPYPFHNDTAQGMTKKNNWSIVGIFELLGFSIPLGVGYLCQ